MLAICCGREPQKLSTHTDSVRTPGCFLQRVRKRLKRNELNVWCVQKSAKKCESVRRGVTRKGMPSDKVGTFGRFRKTIRSAKHAFCTGQVGDREWGMGSRDREEGTPPVEIKRVRKGLIAKGLMSGRCVGESVRIWRERREMRKRKWRSGLVEVEGAG